MKQSGNALETVTKVFNYILTLMDKKKGERFVKKEVGDKTQNRLMIKTKVITQMHGFSGGTQHKLIADSEVLWKARRGGFTKQPKSCSQ